MFYPSVPVRATDLGRNLLNYEKIVSGAALKDTAHYLNYKKKFRKPQAILFSGCVKLGC
jgi:hypothetical protein